MALPIEHLQQLIERRGIAYSADLQSDLGVSQATVSRLLKTLEPRLTDWEKAATPAIH